MAARPDNKENAPDLRQLIMDAARELFVTEGYQNVSMRKIAEKIGYSPTTIYLYFRDKTDLLTQICETTFARLTRNILAIRELSVDPMEKLRLGLKEYIQFGLQHPEQYRLVFSTGLVEFTSRSEAGETAFGTLRSAVSGCVEVGLLKHNDVELISQTLWTGIHGVTSLLIEHKSFPWVDRDCLINSVLDTLISGISR